MIRTHTYYWLALSLVIVLLDQLTKRLVEGHLLVFEMIPLLPSLNLTLTYNTGAAFSFLADQGGWQRWFFVTLAVGVTGVMAVWLNRLRSQERLTAASLSFIIGGAVGNLIDRLWTGRVVDFIDVYYDRWHWPAFNLADSAITLGVILMLVETFRAPPER
jgi:signal peptidase II